MRLSLRRAPRRAALALLLAVPAGASLRAQRPCEGADGTAPSRDLYCIALLPGAAGGNAAGTAQMDWVPGPFTVAVAADGTPRWRLTFTLDSLPPLPRGPAPGFVAWGVEPSFSHITRLGVVRAGRTPLGAVAYDRFLVLVSAEPDTTARERRGPLVLRGESAANRLRPADNYQFFLGALTGGGAPAAAPAAGAMHDAHAGHTGHVAPDSAGWRDVPMYPGLTMLPSEMALRPPVRPWRLGDSAAAPAAVPRRVITLAHGDTLDLSAGVVRRRIAGREYTMFGFNGSIPGPLLRVPQAAEVVVRFRNALPLPSTVHWHGVRLDHRYDGVPDLTQPAVAPGDTFTYRLRFPDAGLYWYHPHVREDIQQELGLYGNIFVRPVRAESPAPVHREEFLILDDLLVGDDGALVPWGLEAPTHAAMGRFGNVMLVNGEAGWRMRARPGEVVRLYLTNASNTRIFNLSFGPGTRLKLVGGDLGRYAAERWVESVVIAPAERYVVDVRFDRPGRQALVSRVRAIDHLFARFFAETDTLGVVEVAGAPAPPLARAFGALRTHRAEADTVRALVAAHAGRAPQRTLELRVAFAGLPFVSQRLMQLDSVYFNPVEWAGTMPGMNWATTTPQARWTLRDPDAGVDNMAVAWRFRRGELVRLRLAGVREVLHGMQHPIHVHGQRFLILAVNGVPNPDPVWKDTALVPAGGTVDVLVEMSNPGRWMVHCHIAEHLQAGMMMAFDVEDVP